MRALIVDDVPLMRKVLTAKLTKAGFSEVVESGDAEKALKLFYARRGVDLIVTDLKMPGMSGEELIRKIRESSTCPDVRVVMISGMEGMENNRQLEELKIDAFIHKQEIMEKLDEVLEETIARIKAGAPLPAGTDGPEEEPLDLEELKLLLAEGAKHTAELRSDRLIVTVGNKELEIPLDKLAYIAKINDIL